MRARSHPTRSAWALCALLASGAASADEGLVNFGHVADEAPQGSLISLVDVAPGLLAYLNNAPVFGIPGTVGGDLAQRTQLTGDWNGERAELAKRGWFVDMYSTSVYKDTTSGGVSTGSWFVQNNQLSVNVDTARAGWWSGGIFHFTLQSRYCDGLERTLNAGSASLPYTGLAFPGPQYANATLPTEYVYLQALNKHASVMVGKISNIFIPDQTLFGDSYKYYFANFNFNKNPMTPNFYNPVAWAALGVYAPSPRLAFAGGVLDPNSQANNFAKDAFERVNLYATAVASYAVNGLPGQLSPAFNWTNKPKQNLADPYGPLAPAQIPEAIAGLLGAPKHGLPVNTRGESWFAIANASQYLYLKDASGDVMTKLKSGQVLRGVGIFGRLGYAPPQTNTITANASIAVFAHGMADSRPYDSFGAGYYYNRISSDLKDSISRMTLGTRSAANEGGVEVFYGLALTPAVRLIASYQHIWNPLTATVAAERDHADIVGARLTIAW